MIIDNNLIFDSAAAITTTRDSTNVIDFSIARDMGDGEFLEVIVQVDTTISTGATTLTTVFAVSTDNSTYTTAAQTDAIATSALTAGIEVLNIHVPMRRLIIATASGGNAKPRYAKLIYTLSAAVAAGKLTAWIGGGRQTNTGYPSGYTVAN